MEFRVIGNKTDLDHKLNTHMVSAIREGYVEAGPEKVCMPIAFKHDWEKISNFKVRDDDVFVSSFPKAGSRWTLEMIWLMLNNLDFDKATREIMATRCPRLEAQCIYSTSKLKLKDLFFLTIDDIGKIDSPRCIGTHLHWTLLPNEIVNTVRKPKIIYVLRDTEDVCVSFYYQNKLTIGYDRDFEEYCQMFLGDRVTYGSIWQNVLSYWNQKDRPNILFIKFVEMKKDLPSVIRKVADFLGKTYSDEQIAKMCEHLSFESMKRNEAFNMSKFVGGAVNPFIRSGIVGEHKLKMSAEIIEKFKIKNKKYFNGTGLSFE